VPSIKSGIVKELKFDVGDTVTAGQLLAVIDDAAESASIATADNAVSEKAPEETSDKTQQPLLQMSPSVRKMVMEHSLDASKIQGTGKNGRIVKSDVEAYMETLKHEPEAPAQTAVQAEPEPAAPLSKQAESSSLAKAVDGERLERRVPMTRLRARIAERLVQSQQEAAILTTFNEVNMKPVMEIRARYKDTFEKKFGVRLGFMSFFVQACVEALKRFPEINASVDGNDIVYHGFYDIGVAVSGPNGLVVPILRDADIMSISEIEQAIIHYANKAKDNTLAIDDITGGTFTISNGGVFGSMLSTPIINPPQSAILGMHNITERAMVVDGEIVVLPMMYLALSYDHRLVDGKSAVQFLVTIKQLLEDPSRMMLGV
jgi:2-oxoglutarate dehydrogenase E2 component (dihydrolipoamide succinyltransferase)